MSTWCRTFCRQRKARLPDCIKILPGKRNAENFQNDRIPLGQTLFWLVRRSLNLSGSHSPAKHSSLAQTEKSILLFFHMKPKLGIKI
tara:strand:- start:2007 stop:2267 length:261 start_codon:yes stop_codon:yes gene_type:complete